VNAVEKMPKQENEEYKAFAGLLSQVLKVSHAEMKARIEQEKDEKKPTSSKASSRASSDKD
jgi:hypothetical protein